VSVDVFQPNHLETELFLKHELKLFAVYSVLCPFTQLYSTAWFSINVSYKGDTSYCSQVLWQFRIHFVLWQ